MLTFDCQLFLRLKKQKRTIEYFLLFTPEDVIWAKKSTRTVSFTMGSRICLSLVRHMYDFILTPLSLGVINIALKALTNNNQISLTHSVFSLIFKFTKPPSYSGRSVFNSLQLTTLLVHQEELNSD